MFAALWNFIRGFIETVSLWCKWKCFLLKPAETMQAFISIHKDSTVQEQQVTWMWKCCCTAAGHRSCWFTEYSPTTPRFIIKRSSYGWMLDDAWDSSSCLLLNVSFCILLQQFLKLIPLVGMFMEELKCCQQPSDSVVFLCTEGRTCGLDPPEPTLKVPVGFN